MTQDSLSPIEVLRDRIEELALQLRKVEQHIIENQEEFREELDSIQTELHHVQLELIGIESPENATIQLKGPSSSGQPDIAPTLQEKSIDLPLIGTPPEGVDEEVPIEEDLSSLEQVISEGSAGESADVSAIPIEEHVPVEMDTQESVEEEALQTESVLDLETRIGVIWLNRIGLVVLIVGFALMARYVHRYFHPWHKVALSYLVSLVLFETGRRLEEQLKVFARPVMAGGMSLAFFTSFASHFVTPMECIPLWGSLLLMSASVVWIVIAAEKWRSETTAGLAIFLGHAAAYTASGDAETFTLTAILFLSLTALILFLRHDWLPLNAFAVFTAFLSHLLWFLQDHPGAIPQVQFWTSITFLTSYYVIFLFADLIYLERLWSRGKEAFGPYQRRAGRGMGPAALILFSTSAALTFYSTGVYWESIHRFLFPLAVLQVFLLTHYRRKGNQDYPVYAVAAVTFTTLGFFSWMGGHTLNMTLAAEALFLLILSRKLRFWFLYPLAQIVLAINFIHFWTSEAHHLADWPVYLGSVLTALVYFVKARMEETWDLGGGDEEIPEPAWALKIRDLLAQSATPLAHIHVLLGSYLLVFQCGDFFSAPHECLTCSFFTFAAIGVALTLRSGVFTIASWLLSMGCVVFFIRHGLILRGWVLSEVGVSMKWLWITDQAAVLFLVGGSWLAICLSRRRRDSLYFVLGEVGLLLASPAVLTACGLGDAIAWLFPLWMAAPLVFWSETGLSAKAFSEALGHSQEPVHLLEQWGARLPIRLVHGINALQAALLTFVIIIQVLPTISSTLWLLSWVSLAVVVAALFRNNPYLALGLILHSVFLLQTVLMNIDIPLSGLQIWWVLTVGVAASVLLMFACPIAGRASFAWAAIILLGFSLRTIAHMLIDTGFNFSLFFLWLLTVSMVWITIELFRVIFLRCEDSVIKHWSDRLGAGILRAYPLHISLALSWVTAALLVWIAYNHFLEVTTAIFVVGLFTIVLALSASSLGSLSLAGACYLTLTLSHFLIYTHSRVSSVMMNNTGLILFLITLPLVLGGAAELLLKMRCTPRREGWKNSVAGAACFPYLLAFVLASTFLEIRADESLHRQAFAYPLQAALALGLFVVGGRFRLGWMQRSAGVYVGWTLLRMGGMTMTDLNNEPGLFLAALFVSIQIILIERLANRQEAGILESIDPGLSSLMRIALVISAGALMVFIIRLSEEMRESWITFSWSLVAMSLVGLGFGWKSHAYRRTGLVIFALSIARAAVIDIAGLELFYRMLAFLCLGACLLGASFLYSRFREDLKQWI
jgi:hypothetical protein